MHTISSSALGRLLETILQSLNPNEISKLTSNPPLIMQSLSFFTHSSDNTQRFHILSLFRSAHPNTPPKYIPLSSISKWYTPASSSH
mmetsp:Transcript_36321/g.66761  ORF Transcript_36321/g.66761 Transcript_36321/m.66761 type:complete len:87 (+) Transcript_36321:372-632(+)